MSYSFGFSSALAEYKKKNKVSLRRRVKMYLSTDWLPEEKARKFSLRENYVQPNFSLKIKKALRNKFLPMSAIHEIFHIVDSKKPKPANILVTGKVTNKIMLKLKHLNHAEKDWSFRQFFHHSYPPFYQEKMG